MAYAAGTGTASSSLVSRMVGASRLSVPTYEEVEADTSATTQALMVVVVVALASGIGTAIASAGTPGANPIAALIGGLLAELIGWGVWSWVMYFVGTRMFGGTATYGEVLRTFGFAYSPGVLLILRFVPVIGGIIALVVFVWRLATGFVAIRQALDISNGATVATVVIGFILYLVVAIILGVLLAAIGLGAAILPGV